MSDGIAACPRIILFPPNPKYRFLESWGERGKILESLEKLVLISQSLIPGLLKEHLRD
jgi:hypothetical protein